MLLNLRITSGNDLKTKLPQYSAKTMSSSLWTTEANGYLTFCVSVAFLYSVIFCFFNCDFLKKYTDLYGRPGLILHPQALEKLANYDWPGNIRELQHTIEKAVILAEKNVIRASDLFIRPGKALSFSEVPNLEEVERQAILAAITQNEGNLTAAAEQLGVSRQTLYNKMKRFNL